MSQEVPFKRGFRGFCMCGPGIIYFKWMKQTKIKELYIDVGILKVAFLSVIMTLLNHNSIMSMPTLMKSCKQHHFTTVISFSYSYVKNKDEKRWIDDSTNRDRLKEMWQQTTEIQIEGGNAKVV